MNITSTSEKLYFTSDIIKNPCVEMAIDIPFRLGMFEHMLKLYFNRKDETFYGNQLVFFWGRSYLCIHFSNSLEGFLKSSSRSFPLRLFTLELIKKSRYICDIRESVNDTLERH